MFMSIKYVIKRHTGCLKITVTTCKWSLLRIHAPPVTVVYSQMRSWNQCHSLLTPGRALPQGRPEIRSNYMVTLQPAAGASGLADSFQYVTLIQTPVIIMIRFKWHISLKQDLIWKGQIFLLMYLLKWSQTQSVIAGWCPLLKVLGVFPYSADLTTQWLQW